MMSLAGGPGTQDPGRINWRNVSLTNLLVLAYEVRSYQISGPEWMTGPRFDIAATLAEGASKQALHLMLQNLLVERFKLKLRREPRESVVYSLVVGRNGPKMKESLEEPAPAADTAAAASPPPRMQKDEDGFPVFPGMRGAYITGLPGRMRIRASHETMAQFVMMLSGQLDHPVTDATELKGKYDFAVTYAPSIASPDTSAAMPEAAADPDIIGALQQIGLKLEQKKGMIDMLVIDHLEKVPTEN
jgi:uncharacterized protein (TIGR03435 family)